jgi:hypothetical protein
MLKGALLQNNFFLTPQLVLMDFETAARNALKAVFPQLILKACFFHFTQCIWRKTQACGLAGQYRQDDNVVHHCHSDSKIQPTVLLRNRQIW